MVSVTNNGSWYSGTGNATISGSSGVFQTVGNASHFLAAGSTHRNAGTTNIHSTLSAAFKSKTTHPPVVIQANGYLGQDYNLGPMVQRDTDIPDRGWHYDALDYALGYSYLTNATITVAPGTAIATFGSGGGTYGLAVAEGARFLCEGTAASPVYIVHHTTVQEQATNQWGKASSGSIMTPWTSVSPPPELKFRFTRWSAMATEIAHMQPYTYQSGMQPVAVVDCEFYGGSVFGQGASLAVTNSLFERVTTALSMWDTGATATYRNCLFYGGEIELLVDDPVANLKDNFFDKTVISDLGNTTHGYNGYITGQDRLTPNGTGDRVLSSLTYQSGTLGRFYLPTGSALINNGSRLASAAGLYHYCTTANQTKEGSSQVDISYHYPSALSWADTVWVEDAVPVGATQGGTAESWNWNSPFASYSGSSNHVSAIYSGTHQHFFYNATATLSVGTNDSLFTYVYLDPGNVPSEVMLQWNWDNWHHRAYWGANLINFGTNGTVSRRYMGPLPPAGQWVRLSVPAGAVGVEGKTLHGMAFTLYGGRAAWDYAGKAVGSSGSAPSDADGDGIPDYLEDANGNGTVNSGETYWLDANDSGLSVLITQPKQHANIP